MLENQNTLFIELVMSDIVIIGDYELLEKQNDGYKEQSRQLGVESGLTSIRHAIGIQMRWY